MLWEAKRVWSLGWGLTKIKSEVWEWMPDLCRSEVTYKETLCRYLLQKYCLCMRCVQPSETLRMGQQRSPVKQPTVTSMLQRAQFDQVASTESWNILPWFALPSSPQTCSLLHIRFFLERTAVLLSVSPWFKPGVWLDRLNPLEWVDCARLAATSVL